jgi:hypothetical protein
VLLVELLRADQVLPLHPAKGAAERARPDRATDTEVHLVPQHCGEHQQQPHECRVQRAGLIHRSERTDREQQRVPGQNRRHDQSGLAEDDQEQDRVDPEVIVGDELGEMLVEMQDEVDEPADQFHVRAQG